MSKRNRMSNFKANYFQQMEQTILMDEGLRESLLKHLDTLAKEGIVVESQTHDEYVLSIPEGVDPEQFLERIRILLERFS